MNRQQYRVVFNRERGQLMAVAEITRAQGKSSGEGGGLGQSRGPARRRLATPSAETPAARGPPTFVALAAALAAGAVLMLVPHGAGAQVRADAEAPKQQQPTVLTTANGVTQVNIQTPSASGVSRNTYSQFDVDGRGVILNNSRTDTSTQLGGWVQGNPWLATGSARVILNEVNSSAPSQLKGFIEIAGRRAELIIANPSGIQVDGAGFINAQSVTLTTGRPLFNDGAIGGYDVRGGAVSVQGAGMNTGDADSAAILARAVQVNAGIWAQRLQVVTGANVVGAATSEAGASVQPQSADPGDTTPRFALDVSALGGMYAGKIALVGTEAGLGVRQEGQLLASAGDLTLDHRGWLSGSGRLQASQTLALRTTGDASLSGPLSGQAIQLTSDTGLTLAGTVAAQQDLQATAPQLQVSGQLQAGHDIRLEATERLRSSGSVTAAGTLTALAQGLLDNQGGSLQAARLVLSAPTVDNRGGRIEQTGSQGLALTVSHWDNADGTVQQQAGQSARSTLAAASNTSSGSGTGNSPGTGSVGGSTGDSTSGSGSGPDAGTGGSTASPGTPPVVLADGMVQTATFRNAGGRVSSVGDIHAEVGSRLTNDGEVSLQSLTLTQTTLDNSGKLSVDRLTGTATAVANRGQLLAQSGITLTTPSIQNSGLIYSGAALGLDTATLQQTATGTLAAAGDAQLRTGTTTNQGLIAGGLGADGQLRGQSALRIDADTDLRSAGRLWASGDLDLVAAHLLLDQAQVQGQRVNLDAGHGAGTLSTVGGQVLASDSLTAQAKLLDNNAGQWSGNQLGLRVETLDNRGGTLVQTGAAALVLRASTIDNRAGLIGAQATDFTLAAQSITTDAGQLQHTGTGRFTVQAEQLSAQANGATRAQVASAGSLSLQAGSARLDGAQVAAETIDITAANLSAVGGQLASRGGALQLNATSAQALDLRQAVVQSGGSAHIATAGDLLTAGATLSAGQDLALQVGQTLHHLDGAQASAGRNLTVDAAALRVSGSRMAPQAPNGQTAAALQYSSFSTSRGALSIRLADGLSAQDGQWIAGQGLSIAAQTLTFAGQHTQLLAGQASGSHAGLDLNAASTLSAADATLLTPGLLTLTGDRLALASSQAGAQDMRLLARSTDTLAAPALALDQSQLVASRDALVQAELGSLAVRGTQLQAGRSLGLRSQAALSIDAPSSAVSDGDNALTGVQITNAGSVQSGGALTLAATSAVNTGNLTSQNSLALQARQLDNVGLVHAGGTAQLRTDTLNNAGVVAATGALTLDGQRLTNDGLLGAGLAPDAQGKLQPLAAQDPRAAVAALTVRATEQLTQTAAGQSLATGELQMNAGDALLAGRASAATLAVTAQRGLQLQQAAFDASQGAALRTDGVLSLDQSRLLTGLDARIDAARANLTDSSVQAGGHADVNVVGALTLQSTRAELPTALRAGGHLAVSADSLSTLRHGDGTAVLLAAGLLADGRLAGSGDLTLTTAANLQTDGVILSAGTVGLTGRNLQLAQSQVQGQTVQLRALAGDIDTRQAQVHAVGSFSATAGALINDGGQLSAIGSICNWTVSTTVAGRCCKRARRPKHSPWSSWTTAVA